MKRSMLVGLAFLSVTFFSNGLISSATVERHWEFNAVKSVTIAGRDLRIISDDVPNVTLSCLDTAFTPDELSPSGSVTNGMLTIVAPSVMSGSARWTLRIPRNLKLDMITGACSGEVRLQDIHASYLRMETESQYLRLDNCDVDSLLFTSNERNIDITSGVIRIWAKIRTPRTIHVTLDRLPDDLLYVNTWSVELLLEEVGDSYCFEIPDGGGGVVSSSFPNCSHEKISSPDTLELPNTIYCISRLGTGWPKVIAGPSIEHFFCLWPMGSSSVREYHKSWTFDSVSSLTVWGSNVKIVSANSPVVRVSYTGKIFACDKDPATAARIDALVELKGGDNGDGQWTIRVPREKKLKNVACYFDRGFTISNLEVESLSGKGGMSWMQMDSCIVDSLTYDAFEGGFTCQHTTINHYGFIKAAEPTSVSLTKLPDRFLQCQAEELYVHLDSMGDAFHLQIPVPQSKDASIHMPFNCDSSVMLTVDSAAAKATEFCVVSRGTGGPRLIIGPYVYNFHLTVGSDKK